MMVYLCRSIRTRKQTNSCTIRNLDHCPVIELNTWIKVSEIRAKRHKNCANSPTRCLQVIGEEFFERLRKFYL